MARFQPAFDQAFDHLRGEHFALHVQLQSGHLLRAALDELGHDARGGAARGAQAQHAQGAIAHGAHVAGELFELFEQDASAGQQQLSGVGQFHLAGGADQQLGIQGLFELLDLLGEWRLRYMQARRRAAEVALFGDRDEVAD